MIFQLFFDVASTIISAIISLLPDVQSLPGEVSQAVDFYIAQIAPWNTYFPFTTVFEILGLILLIEVSLNIFSAVEWVYNKLRGSGS